VTDADPLPREPAGDARADDYARLRSDLVRAVARVCPPWLADRRDDLVQVAMLRVMEVRKAHGRELNAAYLSRTAYSALVDEIRRVRRRREVAFEDAAAPDPPAPEPESPEAQAVRAELVGAVSDCLSCLERDRRLAVTLRLQGHSVPECADVLGWSPKRTENLVYRGLADLRECLAAKGVGP
jgi:RNA polymerase sigma-70 factor (ECF subfamily)